MNKIQQLALKHQIIFKLYLATIAAASTFDFVAINSPFGNFKISYLLCLPLIAFINPIEIYEYLKSNLKILLPIFISLLISLCFSNDALSSLKWCVQLFLNLFLLSCFYFGIKKLKNKNDLFRLILIAILIPGLTQWFCIILNFNPPFLTQTHGNYYRLNGLSFYSNFFTVAISLFFPLIFYRKVLSNVDYILMFFSSFVILQSTARTGMLALLIFIILKFLIPTIKIKTRLIQLLPIFVSIILSFLIPEKTIDNIPSTGFQKAEFFANEMKLGPATSPLERIYIAKQGLKVFLDYPLFGVGPLAYENFIKILSKENEKRYFSETLRGGLYVSHENIWIELLANNGFIFTFFIFIFLIKSLLANFKWNNINIIISLLIYYFINGQFVQNILYPPVFVIWAILSYAKKHENQHNNTYI